MGETMQDTTPNTATTGAPSAVPAPMRERAVFVFLNIGHALDHLFMLLFPTVVLTLEEVWKRPYQELLPLSLGGFIAFGAGALPSGWLGDRWSRRHMMTVFFIGIGLASMLTGLAEGPWGLGLGLALIGLFASIYHPVGTAMVAQGAGETVGRRIGINGVAGNLGVAAAALTAGGLAALWGWRAAFVVPGAVAIAAGIVFHLLTGNGWEAAAKARGKASTHAHPGMDYRKLFALFAAITLLNGLIFNGTLVGMPKVFDIRMEGLALGSLGVSGLVSVIYVVGAFSQILVGYLLDRHPLRSVLILVSLLQIPFLLLASNMANLPLLAISCMMMFTVFGVIPIQDTLIARTVTDAWRSRVYAVKYLVGLGVSPLAVSMVSLVYSATAEFVWLFMIFATLSLLVMLGALLLPRGIALPTRLATAQSGG